jgi:hypothetical protein
MAEIQLFGYRIGKVEDQAQKAKDIPSFAPPPNEDGAFEIAPGGSYGTYLDLEGTAKNEAELVTKYRELANQAEVQSAIEDIINESIIMEDNKSVVEVNLEKVEGLSDSIKDKIRDEFKDVLKLMDFNNFGYDIFRRWYVDGRLYFHMMIDETAPEAGIQELRYIDPRRIRKVREPVKRAPGSPTAQMTLNTNMVTGNRQNPIVPGYNEYFVYTPPAGALGSTINQAIRISKDSVAYIHSGIMDQKNRMVLSAIHKAIKPMNQLRMLEDAVIIYRLARAPERRVFYIDVGNLPKLKADQYVRDVMTKNKNKLVYNAETGEVKDDRKQMTMLEDFYLARRDGSRGTEVVTLPGGQTLGQMEDVEYFRRKLYQALDVPLGRLQSDNTFSFGKASEITRDEIKFSKQILRLRARFNQLFKQLLQTQLTLRGVMLREDWDKIKEDVHFDYLRDNYYAEIKDQEIMNARLGILAAIDPFVGKYFSKQYVMTKILHLSEEDMEELEAQIEEEEAEEPPMIMGPDGQPVDLPPGVDPDQAHAALNPQSVVPQGDSPEHGPPDTVGQIKKLAGKGKSKGAPGKGKTPPGKGKPMAKGKPPGKVNRGPLQEEDDRELTPEEKSLIESMKNLIDNTIEDNKNER